MISKRDGESAHTTVLPDLTAREQELVAAAHRGVLLTCGDTSVDDLAETDDAALMIRADLIRELLLGRRGNLDPRGINLSRARITGTLDLGHITAIAPLVLRDCVMDEPIIMADAQLPSMNLSGSRVAAIIGDGLKVDGDVVLRDGFRVTGADDDRTLRLPGAHIGGQLILVGAELTNRSGPAFNGERLQVDGGLFLHDGFRATGSGDKGAVRLLGARIGGQLVLAGAQLINNSGPALYGDGLVADDAMFLRDGFTAIGAGEDGAVRLPGAHIKGPLEMTNIHLTNKTGTAFQGDGLRADGGIFLRISDVVGEGDEGTIRLMGACVGIQLDMSGTQLANKSGPALVAVRMQVDGSVYMHGGFEAIGAGDRGTVRLTSSRIAGQLNMVRAKLSNQSGPALQGERLLVEDGVYLSNGFRAIGAGEFGAVHLAGAQIKGQLALRGADLTCTTGPLLDVEHASVKSGVFAPATVVCPLGKTTVSPCQYSDRRIDLDGFEYGTLEDSTWQQWRHLIRCHTKAYRPGPYQKLAGAERSAGHDSNARSILITQQDDLRARGNIGGRTAHMTHWLWGVLAGYGYRARRIAGALFVALVLAGGLGWWAGHWVSGPGHHAAERTATSGSPSGTPCSTIEQIGLGIDRGLPLASTGVRARCDLDTASGSGQWFTVGIWVLQALIWALATLAIAGYTGLIRKSV